MSIVSLSAQAATIDGVLKIPTPTTIPTIMATASITESVWCGLLFDNIHLFPLIIFDCITLPACITFCINCGEDGKDGECCGFLISPSIGKRKNRVNQKRL
jgi:hypothetical protein